MHTPNKKTDSSTGELRKFRTTVNLTRDEHQELLRLAGLWDTPLPRVFRRMLLNNKPVVLNTRIALSALDRVGRELQISNQALSKLLELPAFAEDSTDSMIQERKRILRALETNRTKIQDCQATILEIIKKI